MRKYITPSVVISLVALTLSLMGVGYAAISLPRDSVGKAQIKSGAVGSPEVADGSLQPVDFSKAAIAKLTGAKGPQGETGGRGEAGAKGETGATGTGGSGGGTGLNVTGGDGTVVGKFVSMARGAPGRVTVQLPSGLLFIYQTTDGPTWDWEWAASPWVYSLAADCSQPLYTPVGHLNQYGYGFLYRKNDWGSGLTYSIGTERISPAGSARLYVLDNTSTCSDWGPASTWAGDYVRIHGEAAPPVLTTPVTIG